MIICTPTMWPRLGPALGKPDLMEDPRFQNIFDLTYASDMDGIFLEWLSERTKQQAAEEMQTAGIAVTLVNCPEDAVLDGHFRERGFFLEITQKWCGTHAYPGFPWKFTRAPQRAYLPPPGLGQPPGSAHLEITISPNLCVEFRITALTFPPTT